MPYKTVQFLSLLLAALNLAPAMAHLLELPNKIHLPEQDYLVVQQIYRGWALLGIVVIAAIVSTLALAVLSRDRRRTFVLALLALVSLLASQAVFWIFTFPANRQTDNWTMLPENWMLLRRQWEYSHAAGAGLDLLAFVMVALAVLTAHRQPRA